MVVSLLIMSESFPEDDSPYPEVRSAVSNTDDPSMPINTFRAWFIGIIWAIIIPGLNQFFFFRYPSVTVGGVSTILPRNVILDSETPLLGRRSIARLSNWSTMGTSSATGQGLRYFSQSGSIQCERACPDHDHGDCWISVCLRREPRTLVFLFFSLTSNLLDRHHCCPTCILQPNL